MVYTILEVTSSAEFCTNEDGDRTAIRHELARSSALKPTPLGESSGWPGPTGPGSGPWNKTFDVKLKSVQNIL